MAKEPIVWICAYISSKYLNKLNADLRKHKKYLGIRTFIPLIRVLKKRYKGSEYFEDVPFLFNYGFFRVPKYFITNPHFLDAMKEDISAIYSWVYDRAREDRGEFKMGQKSYLYNPKGISIVTQSELMLVKRMQGYKSIFTKKDIDNLYPGKVVILKGYPFDDLEAEVVKIHNKARKVEVRLLISNNISRVTVSFENIFFTMYQSNYMNTPMKEQSLEEFKEKSGNINNLMRDE